MFREGQSERELQPVTINEIHKLFPGKQKWANLSDYLETNV